MTTQQKKEHFASLPALVRFSGHVTGGTARTLRHAAIKPAHGTGASFGALELTHIPENKRITEPDRLVKAAGNEKHVRFERLTRREYAAGLVTKRYVLQSF